MVVKPTGSLTRAEVKTNSPHKNHHDLFTITDTLSMAREGRPWEEMTNRVMMHKRKNFISRDNRLTLTPCLMF